MISGKSVSYREKLEDIKCFCLENTKTNCYVHCVLGMAMIDSLTFIGKQIQKRAGSQGREEKEAAGGGRVQETKRRQWKNK